MHELGIARDLWATVTRQAQERGLHKITRVVVTIGEASGIEKDFLRHSFVDHIFPGSIAEGAQLEIVIERLSARCGSCGAEITTKNLTSLDCPDCGGIDIRILSGRDTYVKSIEGA